MKLIRKTYTQTEVTKAEGEKRTLYVKISTPTPDRSNDVVIPGGVLLENYQKNPIVAAFHRYDRPPIGKATEINVTNDGVIAKVAFTPKGVNPEADMIYELNRKGYMNAWSIGFMPIESEERPDGGRIYKEWELYEFSAVLVPDNPDALTMVRSKGFDPDQIIEEQKKSEETEEIKAEEVLKPYPEEHSCRLRNPDDFENDSFRSTTRKHDGKEYRVIMGKLKGQDTMTEQAYRYPKDTWEKEAARTHCENHGGKFEAASGAQAQPPEEKEEKIEISKDLFDELISQTEELQLLIESEIEQPEVKEDTLAFLKAVQIHLRQSDKHTGLALRLLKTLKVGGGEK